MTPYYETELGKLYHGDCLEIMSMLETVDLVLTDPPYGINHKTSHGASWENTVINGDCNTDTRDSAIDGIPRIAPSIAAATVPE